MDKEPELLINELAKQAGVSVRTIRYYMDQGLLPTPQMRGKYAYFSKDYLERLELIRRLKEAFFPLKEIRDRIAPLSIWEVRKLLKQMNNREIKSTSASMVSLNSVQVDKNPIAVRESASEYIAGIISQQNQIPNAPPSQVPEFRITVPSSKDVWQRIELTDGIELHVNSEVNKAQGERVRQLIDFARNLFNTRS